MAPVIRIEPNDHQNLLCYDGFNERLALVRWLPFIQSFRGFNLYVAKNFSKTFDGVRVKFGDMQLMRVLFLEPLVSLLLEINGSRILR
jgi:hypothetical protein